MIKGTVIAVSLMFILLFGSYWSVNKEEVLRIEPKIQQFDGDQLISQMMEYGDKEHLYLINHFYHGLVLKINGDGSFVASDWEIYLNDKQKRNYIRIESGANELEWNEGQTITVTHQSVFPLERVLKAIEAAPWSLILKELPSDGTSYELWLHDSYYKGEKVKPHPFSNDAPYLVVDDNHVRIESNHETIVLNEEKLDFFIHSGEVSINMLISY